MVRRAAAALDLGRDRGAAVRGAQPHRRRRRGAAGDRRRRWWRTRAATASCRSRRAGCSPPASRAPGSSCWSRRTTSCWRTSRRGGRSGPSSRAFLGTEPAPHRRAVTTLSPRELDVLELVAAGLTNEAIAERLCLSVRTVERHLSNIYAKLRVSGKAGRAAAAVAVLRDAACRPPRGPFRVACWHRCRRRRAPVASRRSTNAGPLTSGRRHGDGAHAQRRCDAVASRSRRTTCAAAAGSDCTSGSGATRTDRRSCSSTAGRRCQLCWSRQIAGPLADDFRIVTFDLRGHGMSEKPLDAEHYVDARLWADDLAAVIEQLGWTGRCWSPGPTAGSS